MEENVVETPMSLCTLATERSSRDLGLLLRSLELVMCELPVWVLCSKEAAEKIGAYDLDLRVDPSLPEDNGDASRQEMVAAGKWTDFMLRKCDAIDEAVAHHGGTLFVDSDIVFLEKPETCFSWGGDVALSRHMIREADERRYGRYNGGYVATRDAAFTTWWRQAGRRDSSFMEQECLTRAPLSFRVGELPATHNFGWWRLFQCDDSAARKAAFAAGAEGVRYGDAKLVSVHTHFWAKENSGMYAAFNSFVLSLLAGSGRESHALLRKEVLS